MDAQYVKHIEAIIGAKLFDTDKENSFKVAVNESLFERRFVHYELYKNHIELHLEPKNPKSSVRYFAEFLKENLNENDGKFEDRKFCYSAFVLTGNVDYKKDINELCNKLQCLRTKINSLIQKYMSQIEP